MVGGLIYMKPSVEKATDGFLAECHIVMDSFFRCPSCDYNLPFFN